MVKNPYVSMKVRHLPLEKLVYGGSVVSGYRIVADEALNFYQLFNFLNILLQEALLTAGGLIGVSKAASCP
jgi:hypothetical protein